LKIRRFSANIPVGEIPGAAVRPTEQRMQSAHRRKSQSASGLDGLELSDLVGITGGISARRCRL